MQRVWIYGSLKRGRQHHEKMGGAKFLGEVTSAPGYNLVMYRGYPALVLGGLRAIQGELYQVSSQLLTALDAFEEVPTLYQRAEIQLGTGQTASAYVISPEAAIGCAEIQRASW